ncbi:hypothetical protein F0562_002550 [Nyssa sinensis]|uniref:Uncharacterized protein n=1 Tax=Nyssa sinensis TaxID=561372 RepID=A0A5J5C792_9ASTE|nr:hypothetical protein F0562_002550 [Nyssa sinensis]
MNPNSNVQKSVWIIFKKRRNSESITVLGTDFPVIPRSGQFVSTLPQSGAVLPPMEATLHLQVGYDNL